MSDAATSSNLDRELLLDQVLHANSPAEIRASWRALDAWMDAHPDDVGMPYAFGLLYRLAECFGMIPAGETMFSLEDPAPAAAA